jgi:hypothetical protein
MSVTLKDLQPGCIVFIAGFDGIPEHQFQVDEVHDDLVTGTVLTGPLAGEYGEPEIKLITAVIPQETTTGSKH